MLMLRSSLALLSFVPASLAVLASENWFLPYEPDEHTLVLLHLDQAGDIAANAGQLPITAQLVGGVKRAHAMFGGGVQTGRGVKPSLSLKPHEALRFAFNQPFTVELWFWPESGRGGSLWSLGTRFYLKVAPDQGTFSFGYRAASFPIRWYLIPGPKIPLRHWHHVALTHDENRQTSIFLDGRLIGTTQHSAEGDYAKGGGGCFGSHDGWTAFLPARLDEIRISDLVREYRPLISQHNLLPQETIQLQLDVRRLPAVVRSVRLTARDGAGKVLTSADFPRADLASAGLPASQLPPAPRRPDPEHRPDPAAVKRANCSLNIVFLGEGNQQVAGLSTPVKNVGDQLRQISAAHTALQREADQAAENAEFRARATILQALLGRIVETAAQRDTEAAYARLAAARRLADSLSSGEAAYRERLHKFVRSHPASHDIRLTMSWPGDADRAREAFPWAHKLGANELVSGHGSASPEGLKAWKDAGYKTALLAGVPVHSASWLKDHPEQAQVGYWVTKPVQAEADSVTVPVVSPTWGGARICRRYDPQEHWRVLDQTSGEFLAAGRWSVSKDLKQVTIQHAIVGHSYAVYFLTWAPGLADVLLPDFQPQGVRMIDELLTPFDGVLDTFWFDDLGFAYPGPTPQGVWDWEAYTLVGRPERLARFEQAAGITFDPRWLVNAPHTIEADVPREYLQWMSWVHPQMNAWLRQASEACRKHGVKSWLYWGDCHVGIEPFLGALTEGRLDQTDKPAGDPVTMRALCDFPGDTFRRFRVDWVYAHKVGNPAFARHLRAGWANVRRGMLTKPISGLYWMPFDNAAGNPETAVRDNLVQAMADINDEFRLLADHLAGQSAWTADLDLYVVNVWGRQYSWRPWGEARLVPLTSLPIRVHFLSLLEIEQSGIPENADVLYCYGMPNTAQNGGHWWKSPRVVRAVRDFVQQGGGFIGLQAPGAYGGQQLHWPLADLLGVTGEGTPEYHPLAADASLLADVGGELNPEAGASVLISARSAAQHFLAQETKLVSGLGGAVSTSATGSQDILYFLRRPDGKLFPGLVARSVGRGRCVYFAGYSREGSYDRLFRRAVFWAAQREAEASRLDALGSPAAFVYAYPDIKTLALHNTATEPASVTVHCDPTILGLAAGKPWQLQDVVTGERISVAHDEFATALPPECTRLLEVLGAP